jgi:S1-C subfamily serine protease
VQPSRFDRPGVGQDPSVPAMRRALGRRVGLWGALLIALAGALALVLPGFARSPAAPAAASAPPPAPSDAPSPAPSGAPAAGTSALDPTSKIVSDVVRSVAPAVVVLDLTIGDTASTQGGGFSGAPIASGTGSGVIIDPDGLILTNRHVAGGATTITATLADGRQFDGKLVGVDPLTDFAFVRIDATDLPAAHLGTSADLSVGQLAIAIGDPLGEFPGTVTVGVVSGLDRTIPVADQMTGATTVLRHLIQTDASINPGNSGGPLVDANGRVIGIDTAASGAAQGIGFALPIDLAKPIIEQVKAGQDISRPWIGIQYQEITGQVQKDQSLPVGQGAVIESNGQSGQPAVLPQSPARDAGLREGDIITAMDGTAIDRDHQLDLLLLAHAPGDTVTLTVLRDGKTMQVDVTLGNRPANP